MYVGCLAYNTRRFICESHMRHTHTHRREISLILFVVASDRMNWYRYGIAETKRIEERTATIATREKRAMNVQITTTTTHNTHTNSRSSSKGEIRRFWLHASSRHKLCSENVCHSIGLYYSICQTIPTYRLLYFAHNSE